MKGLHPVLEAAARGEMPEWTVVSPRRFAHMERVSRLMRTWAKARGVQKINVERWAAVGYLHDALRGESPARLRSVVPRRFRHAPGAVLHGPAAAEKLRAEGVEDERLLVAIEYHTLGSRKLTTIGRALYAADFLEPGRTIRPKWRAKLRKRMPREFDAVVAEIVGARISHLLQRQRPIRPETMGLWNALQRKRARGKKPWASASEV